MTGKVEEKKHHSFTVPSGTVLAFSCTKLDIKEDGKVTMHVGVDKVDALPPKENLQTKPEDTVGECQS